MDIHDIFPVPIGIESIPVVPQDEHEFLLNLEYHKHVEYDMIVSKNKYVLNDNIPTIKNFIESCIQEYAPKVLATHQKLRFLQSWCTKHDNIPQQTFPHIHQNSIISGTYYVSANEQNEGITFYKDNAYKEKYITWSTDPVLMQQYHWNWQWAKFPISTGMLVLFPSQLKHAVIGNISPNIRCSLAFNTWFEGDIGDEHNFSILGAK